MTKFQQNCASRPNCQQSDSVICIELRYCYGGDEEGRQQQQGIVEPRGLHTSNRSTDLQPIAAGLDHHLADLLHVAAEARAARIVALRGEAGDAVARKLPPPGRGREPVGPVPLDSLEEAR